MPGAAVKLGPFKSGVVNVTDATAIPDDSLAACTNFDFDLNGFLVSRPAIVPEAYSPIITVGEIARNLVKRPVANLASQDNFFGWMTSSTHASTWAEYATGGPVDGPAAYLEARLGDAPSATQFKVLGKTLWNGSNAGVFPVVAGKTYNYSMWARADFDAVVTVSHTTLNADGTTTETGGGVLPVGLAAGSWVRLSASFTVAAGMTVATVSFSMTSASTETHHLLAMTGGLFTVVDDVSAPTPPWFDGDTPDEINPVDGSTIAYSWTGTANASEAIATSTSPATQEHINPLGYYVSAAGDTFLVATTTAKTWIYNIATKAWTEIWAHVAAGFAQYDNKIVVCSTTRAGGYWEAGTFTDTATMPFGQQIVFYQERFWAFGAQGTSDATTIWFSKLNVISPASSIFTWATSDDYFTVAKGDGQWITGLLADTNALVIFRNSSTYQFTFPSTPITGTLRQLNSTTGADNMWCYAKYQDFYLVQSQGFLYQFINYRYYPLNTKKIELVPAAPPLGSLFDLRLSVLGPRIILWYRGALWVYNIVQNTWSQWDSPTTSAGIFMQIPPTSLTGDARTALVVSGENDPMKWGLWRIQEDTLLAGDVGEEMIGHIRTKAYSIDQPAQYKRMMYWTVQAFTARGLTGIAFPIALSTDFVTWDELDTHTWDELDQGSWDNPVVSVPTIIDEVPFPTLAPVNTVTKLIKDMRFLNIYFEISMTFDGTARTSPTKIYSITPYMKVHAGISKKVS